MTNSTRWPSRKSSNTAPRTELRWKKCSIPPSSRINPKPLSIRSRAIVPVGMPVSSDCSRLAAKCTRASTCCADQAENACSVGASPYEVKATCDLPGFFLVVLVFVALRVIFVIGLFVVKVFIIKDFVVFVLQKEIHVIPKFLGVYSLAGLAAVTPAGCAAAAGAPGSEEYVVQ